MKISRCGFSFRGLAIALFAAGSLYPCSLRAQIVPDSTLPTNSQVRTIDNTQFIEAGSQVGNNLFHSFAEFSVPNNQTAYFNNGANIQHIITRVTGKSISRIDGLLRANGTADLFLINPNGISFGENATLNIGGSLIASTATSLNFADGNQFSATQPQSQPLLTVSVPVGLQFGKNPAPIRNQSQASVDGAINFFRQPVGLQVSSGNTLALVGGDVILEGGNLTADSGRIELGSVGMDSLVGLNGSGGGWVLEYEGMTDFQNIQLMRRNQGNRSRPSTVDASGDEGSGGIQIQGDVVESIGSFIGAGTQGEKQAGNININVSKFVLRDGAQVITGTLDKGAAGNLILNASESIELIGGEFIPSILSSDTSGSGKGGNVILNTEKLLIDKGAGISVSTTGKGDSSGFILATGKAGNLTINATESVEISGKSALGASSTITSETFNSAAGGTISISTPRLILRDGGKISVSSLFFQTPPGFTVVGDTNNLGDAGDLNVAADSITLNNEGRLISQTDTGNGGNINLELQNLLLMRRNSEISTNAGIFELAGDGGNIRVNMPDGFIVATPQENNDITANAFTGSGGRVEITANGILGIEPLSRDELGQILATDDPQELNPQRLSTSNITAISQQNPDLDGELSIDAPDIDPGKGLVDLPKFPLSMELSRLCEFRRGEPQSSFIYTRRGGMYPSPNRISELTSSVDIGWISLAQIKKQTGNSRRNRISPQEIQAQIEAGKPQEPVVEAIGWRVKQNGDIVLIDPRIYSSGKHTQIASVLRSPANCYGGSASH